MSRLCLAALLLAGCIRSAESVPRAYQPTSPLVRWDNVDWSFVLARVVTHDGYVDYDRLLGNVDGVRDALYRYVARINIASPESRPEMFSSETDRLAYYLNAYHALGVYAVVRRRDFPENIYFAGILHTSFFAVGGRRMNLDQLENGFLRPVGDPRIHFALNRMSRSSPPLRREPYDAARLDEQLDEQGFAYLSDPRGVQGVDEDTIRLTELIARFYPQDFLQMYERRTGAKPVSLVEALRPYAAPDSPIQTARDYVALPFDWSLNRAGRD